MIRVTTTSAHETVALGREVGVRVQPSDVILLTGDLGAGKTQFTRGLGAALGISAPVTSPTFNILIHHEGERLDLYHFDLYRLETADGLEDIDFYATIESGGVSLIEWGNKFPESLESADVVFDFQVTGPESREITVEPLTERGRELIREVKWSVC